MFRHVLLFLFLATAPALAVAGPYEDGLAAYEKGEYQKALELYTSAAEQGVVDAQLLLGFLYFNGEAVAKNYPTAYKWFKKAADQGDARSQSQLGMMYDTGEGVPQDFKTAAFWYDKAARQNFGQAQDALGLMYALGQGVPKNLVLAHVWLNLAAAQGVENAVENREEVEKLMSEEEIDQAQKRAREMLEQMAN